MILSAIAHKLKQRAGADLRGRHAEQCREGIGAEQRDGRRDGSDNTGPKEATCRRVQRGRHELRPFLLSEVARRWRSPFAIRSEFRALAEGSPPHPAIAEIPDEDERDRQIDR